MITKYNANARTVLLNKSNGFLQQFPKATELDDDGTGAFCMFLFQLDRLHTVFFLPILNKLQIVIVIFYRQSQPGISCLLAFISVSFWLHIFFEITSLFFLNKSLSVSVSSFCFHLTNNLSCKIIRFYLLCMLFAEIV